MEVGCQFVVVVACALCGKWQSNEGSNRGTVGDVSMVFHIGYFVHMSRTKLCRYFSLWETCSGESLTGLYVV
jgi:hypothetical protein